MEILLAALRFAVGLALVIYFAEKLVSGAVGTARAFGLSAFVISVVFIGFDPENLAVGAAGAYEEVAGIALGSILGAAMVAVALAFGITAILAPMRFGRAPGTVLLLPVLAVLLFGLLALDGRLSRTDGAVLVAGYVGSLGTVWALSRRGLHIAPSGEVAETLERDRASRWRAFGLLILSLAAIVAGSELVVDASERIIGRLGVSDTVFGMTILALLVSIEELARELPAARRGRPEISYGNVAGSIFAFFLLNAGVIALVRPVPVAPDVLRFYLPVAFATTVLVALLMRTRRVSRGAGIALLVAYAVFAIGGYVL
ncbi:MAG: sodium:calcium antiporter [Gemmatimonadota bacterium]